MLVRCLSLCSETQFVRAKVSIWKTGHAVPVPRPRWSHEHVCALVICCPGREEALHRTSFYKDSSWVLYLPTYGVSSVAPAGVAHRAVQLSPGRGHRFKGPHLSVHQLAETLP